MVVDLDAEDGEVQVQEHFVSTMSSADRAPTELIICSKKEEGLPEWLAHGEAAAQQSNLACNEDSTEEEDARDEAERREIEFRVREAEWLDDEPFKAQCRAEMEQLLVVQRKKAQVRRVRRALGHVLILRVRCPSLKELPASLLQRLVKLRYLDARV